MSRLKSRFILHLLILFAFFLIILMLLIFPGNVHGRPLVIIQHKSPELPRMSEESRAYQNNSRLREAQRQVFEAQRAKDRAYVPHAPWDYQAQQWEEWQADRNLENAKRHLERVQSDQYLQKRKAESLQRERKIKEQMKKQAEQRGKYKINSPAHP